MKHEKRDKNKPNPQKGPGIVNKMRSAKSKKQVDKLLAEAEGYDHISASTLNKVNKLAAKKQKNFK